MIDTCICCGEYIPEGRNVCPLCESNPIHYKDKKEAILHCLKMNHTGKKNAVHSKELEQRFSLDARAVRRKISSLRKEGYPICSGDVGYYFAGSQKEINSTVGRLNDLMTGVSNARTGLLFSSLQEPVMSIEVTVHVNGGDD